MPESSSPVPSRARAIVALMLATSLGAAAGWWAAAEVLIPRTTDDEPTTVTAEVREGTVSRQFDLNAVARREATLRGRNVLSGTVTRVRPTEPVAENGAHLYAVDEHWVVAVEGTIPFYRTMESGMAGADVHQLQAALASLGHLNIEPDGQYGPATVDAVRSWQESMNVEPTGLVAHGHLVAVGELPQTLELDEAIAVGVRLGGGEPAVWGLANEPEVVVPMSDGQLQEVQPGTPAEVTVDGTVLVAEVVDIRQVTGGVELVLGTPEGGSVCGDRCEEVVPARRETVMRAKILLVPPTSGPTVPEPAVIVHPDGRTSLRVQSAGSGFVEVDVEVLAASDGVVVVSGVDLGDVVFVGGSQ